MCSGLTPTNGCLAISHIKFRDDLQVYVYVNSYS